MSENVWRCMHCGDICGPMWGDPEVLRDAVERGRVVLECVACASTGEAERTTKDAADAS